MTIGSRTRPPRARMPLSLWIVALALPLVVTAVAVALQLAWLPQLPDPIATHWGWGGTPDGFSPIWTLPVLTAAVLLGLMGLFALILGISRGVAPTVYHKVLAVTSLAVSLLLGVMLTASVAIQRGLDDARDAGSIDVWVWGGLALAVVAAGLAWIVLPAAVSPTLAANDARPLTVVSGERTVWIATTRVSNGAIVAVLSAIGFAFAATAFAVAASEGLAWPIVIIPVLLLGLLSIALVWRVRVDPAGLTVRSLPFGWPRVRIPVADIARVQTSDVDPLAEFGGWGWRWAPGRSFGAISQRGPAIEVTRHDGRRFTVTVDDAATGAALLAAYSADAG